MPKLRRLSIGNGAFNGAEIMKFINLNEIESIEIGDNCFSNVNEYLINGLNELKSMRIGSNSFTNKLNSYGNDNTKSFHILNCESLESIEIGEYSFSDYAGEFELKNLSKLETLTIGHKEISSCNFYYSSFVVKSSLFFNTSK